METERKKLCNCYLSCFCEPSLNGSPAMWTVLPRALHGTAKPERSAARLMSRNGLVVEKHIRVIRHFYELFLCCIVVVLPGELTRYFKGLKNGKFCVFMVSRSASKMKYFSSIISAHVLRRCSILPSVKSFI